MKNLSTSLLRLFLVLTIALSSLLLSSCSKDGDEFLGFWKNAKREFRIVEIQRNDDSFLVIVTSPSNWDGRIETRKTPSHLANGVMNIKNGIFSFDIAIDKTSGNLHYGDEEFIKISSDELEKIRSQIEEYNKKKDEMREQRRKALNPRNVTPEP